MDSLTSHFQSTSRAQRVRNDRVERGRITHKRTEDIYTRARAQPATLQDRAGDARSGRKKKQTEGFRPGPWYYLINHPNLSRCHTIWACAGERRLYQFSFRATFDVLAAVPWPLFQRALPYSPERSRLSANSITKLRFRVANRRLISFYVLPEIRISRGVDESPCCRETR